MLTAVIDFVDFDRIGLNVVKDSLKHKGLNLSSFILLDLVQESITILSTGSLELVKEDGQAASLTSIQF